MPSGQRRDARDKRLIRNYKQAKSSDRKRRIRLKICLCQALQRVSHGHGLSPSHSLGSLEDLTELSDLSSMSELSSLGGVNSEGEQSEDIFNSGLFDEDPFDDWQSTTDLSSLFSEELDDELEDIPPELLPADVSDDDSDFDDDLGRESDDDGFISDLVDEVMDCNADDEIEVDSDEDEAQQEARNEVPLLGKWDRLRRWIGTELLNMYSSRYEVPRDEMPRGPSYLHHVLVALKNSRQDMFRQALRVNPTTFDALVAAIENDPVFLNNSNNSQLPVEEQLAITLYRFGHDGNAAGLQGTANWAGVGKGTVTLVVRRVMTALLRPSFMNSAVRWPTPAEKEEAKQWVEKHSCHAWRNGWCFVDGTLVPFASRPAWYGESYFDRKNRYSLNFQIVNMPNLQIIDFSFGHTGSTHDSSAWEATRLAQNHEELMDEGEWIWADSAYPINTWIIAPYKAPERNLPDNEVFNNHVSMLRIRSEHAIGFLKGRFQSLKNLRLNIRSKETHIIATYWVAACIGVHNFALRHEQDERGSQSLEPDEVWDRFIDDGLDGFSSSDSDSAPLVAARSRGHSRLHLAKRRREKLKEKLFHHKEKNLRCRARERRGDLGVDSPSSSLSSG